MKAYIPPEHAPWCEKLPQVGYTANMCPHCDGESRVTKTEYSRAGLLMRYRRCTACRFCYKTVELLAFGDLVSLKDKTVNQEAT